MALSQIIHTSIVYFDDRLIRKQLLFTSAADETKSRVKSLISENFSVYRMKWTNFLLSVWYILQTIFHLSVGESGEYLHRRFASR